MTKCQRADWPVWQRRPVWLTSQTHLKPELFSTQLPLLPHGFGEQSDSTNAHSTPLGYAKLYHKMAHCDRQRIEMHFTRVPNTTAVCNDNQKEACIQVHVHERSLDLWKYKKWNQRRFRKPVQLLVNKWICISGEYTKQVLKQWVWREQTWRLHTHVIIAKRTQNA